MAWENKYSMLKRLGFLMALETGGVVATIAIYFVRIVRLSANLEMGPIRGAFVYILWTLWAMRISSWATTLATLSRLEDLCKSFRKAQIWYLLRILLFLVTPLTVAAVNYLYHDSLALSDAATTGGPGWLLLRVPVVFFPDLALCGFAETFMLSAGNRNILYAGAEMLESFGMESQAEQNRRCAKRLMGISWAALFVWESTLAIVAGVWFSKGVWVLVFEEGDSMTTLLRRLCRVAFAFFVPGGVCVVAGRVLAAVRVSRTYRAIEELTR